MTLFLVQNDDAKLENEDPSDPGANGGLGCSNPRWNPP